MMFVVMNFVDHLWSASFGGRSSVSKDPYVCRLALIIRQNWVKIGEDGGTDDGPAAAVTERFVILEENDWFFLYGNEKILCHCL